MTSTFLPQIAVMHRRVYSVATEGLALFAQPLSTLMGGLTVDLLSAPIPPGEYALELSATMGGIGLYLPRYARCFLDGLACWGGRRAETGPHVWNRLREMTAGRLDLPVQPPSHAFASFGERPVTLYLHIDALMGGAVLYRL